MELSTSVQYIKGVGPKTAQRFAKLVVETAGQLLEIGRASCRERV